MTTEKNTAANKGLAKKRVQCLNEVLCFYSSSVLADSIVIRNPSITKFQNLCCKGGATVLIFGVSIIKTLL